MCSVVKLTVVNYVSEFAFFIGVLFVHTVQVTVKTHALAPGINRTRYPGQVD
jgi:hypothetical protein